MLCSFIGQAKYLATAQLSGFGLGMTLVSLQTIYVHYSVIEGLNIEEPRMLTDLPHNAYSVYSYF